MKSITIASYRNLSRETELKVKIAKNCLHKVRWSDSWTILMLLSYDRALNHFGGGGGDLLALPFQRHVFLLSAKIGPKLHNKAVSNPGAFPKIFAWI